ncbi:MAG TPA: hypothetical protein VE029_05235 [Rhizobacter sp.]|nr:hypothetical protein [Rhizobacter sp.]
MHTETKYGIEPAAHDGEILIAIARAIRPAPPGKTTIVGIRNRSGSVYRVVYANGVAEALALADSLEKLGLVDDRCEADKARERCDAIYAVRGFHPSQHGVSCDRFPATTDRPARSFAESRRSPDAGTREVNLENR